MRVLLYEQFYGGHHFQYLHYLLTSLIDITDEVILAMTEESQKTPAFSDLIAPFSNRINIISIPPKLTRGITGWIELYRNLHNTVRQTQPDHLFIPTADSLTSRACLLKLDSLLKTIPTEVGIHRGLGQYSVGFRQAVEEALHRQMLACSPWSTIHVVNAAFYETIQSQHNTLSRRVKLLPDPVPPNPRCDKSESRIRLGIPENGRYIGFFGVLDKRRIIDKFLEAFQASTLRTNDRLFFGGRLSKEFQRLVEHNYQNLVKQDRLIILNRYLSEEEFTLGFSAVDVICIPSLFFGGASSILLKGIAAGRPILANDFGWSRMIIKRFQVGWLCNMLNPEEFSHSLQTALEKCEEYQESEAIKRLLEFHSPKNFGASWSIGLRKAMGQTTPELVRSWEWVLEALPPERRMLY
jgi:glycosyltransferase involved in cell wall biosynthesis